MKLSIIIPYYNVAQYTDELLDCLAPQITDDVEVILVDDGSDISYKTKYEWCKVYRQKNKGVSGARNKGLELSQGEYVAFIDSDDLFYDSDSLEMLYTSLDEDYDMVSGGEYEEDRSLFFINEGNLKEHQQRFLNSKQEKEHKFIKAQFFNKKSFLLIAGTTEHIFYIFESFQLYAV